MVQSFLPDDNISENNVGHTELRKQSNRLSPTPVDQFLTVEEIGARLMKKNDRVSWRRWILGEHRQELYVAAPEVLVELYNSFMKYFCFPGCFNRSLVGTVMKNNGVDHCLIKAWRPISLLSVFGKVLEGLIIDRIMHYLRSNGLPSEDQFGFTQIGRAHV